MFIIIVRIQYSVLSRSRSYTEVSYKSLELPSCPSNRNHNALKIDHINAQLGLSKLSIFGNDVILSFTKITSGTVYYWS